MACMLRTYRESLSLATFGMWPEARTQVFIWWEFEKIFTSHRIYTRVQASIVKGDGRSIAKGDSDPVGAPRMILI